MDYTILKAELTADPLARGYASMTDTQAATSLNTANITRKRKIIPAWEVIEATVVAEWTALSAAEKQRYQTLTGAGDVNVQGVNTRAAFGAMFAAGTQTRTNLLALENDTPWSRREQLGLPVVYDHHVAYARSH
jgi:hypothetical protein